MRALHAIIVGSAGFDNIAASKHALNEVWRIAGRGRRQVDFSFRSTWRDAEQVERGTSIAYDLVYNALNSGEKHSWINEVNLINMLELKGTSTREWMGVENPDIVVLLESSTHDEWLDVFRRYCRDIGAQLIQINDTK
jgi:hypothetical protein